MSSRTGMGTPCVHYFGNSPRIAASRPHWGHLCCTSPCPGCQAATLLASDAITSCGSSLPHLCVLAAADLLSGRIRAWGAKKSAWQGWLKGHSQASSLPAISFKESLRSFWERNHSTYLVKHSAGVPCCPGTKGEAHFVRGLRLDYILLFGRRRLLYLDDCLC